MNSQSARARRFFVEADISVSAPARATVVRHFPSIEPQTAIVPRRATWLKREPPIMPLLVPSEPGCRPVESLIRQLPPSERRSYALSAQHQPMPCRSSAFRPVGALATLHQRRRHTKPLDAIQDRGDQLRLRHQFLPSRHCRNPQTSAEAK